MLAITQLPRFEEIPGITGLLNLRNPVREKTEHSIRLDLQKVFTFTSRGLIEISNDRYEFDHLKLKLT